MRKGVVTPLLVMTIAVGAGGWLLQQGVDRAENVYVKVRLFEEVVERVESSFVDEVDRQGIYSSAIDGVLQDLQDPYTSFLEAQDFENLRIRGIDGDYGGVGLEVVDRNGWVTVVSPIPGTPGSRVGIRAGDQFFEIEGQAADTMSTDQAVALLRGPPGSEVSVKILRPGVEEPIPFTLTRAIIELKAVPFTALLDGGIGYVPLRSVLESSSTEIRHVLDSLQTEGMKAVVLDLRGNPGGLLDEGIAVSDVFLAEGLTIVETRGRERGQNVSYDASRPDGYPGLPIVTLVNGSSASASEIIAGALQDHDRALIVGESTFGKGSVQSLYPLSDGNGPLVYAGRSLHRSGSGQPESGGRRVRGADPGWPGRLRARRRVPPHLRVGERQDPLRRWRHHARRVRAAGDPLGVRGSRGAGHLPAGRCVQQRPFQLCGSVRR
jgi:carboxyl-terminal processing protease